jgi:PRTRC genetic system protein A
MSEKRMAASLIELRRLYWQEDNAARTALLTRKDVAVTFCKEQKCHRPLRPEDRDDDLCIWCQIESGLPIFRAQRALDEKLEPVKINGKRRRDKRGKNRASGDVYQRLFPCTNPDCKKSLLTGMEEDEGICWDCIAKEGRDPAALQRAWRAAQNAGFQGKLVEAPAAPPPPPDPAILRELTDVRIGVPERLVKPVTYAIGQDGIYLIKENRIGRGIRKVEAKTVEAFVPAVKGGFQLALPKVPFECLGQVVNFFRAIPAVEAFVYIWWSPERRRYEIEVPPQEVGGASVNHDGGLDSQGGRILVMEIHSHTANMSAFWSGTDDADEKRHERLFGVIGKVKEELPEMKFRANVGGGFIDLEPGDLFEIPERDLVVNVPLKKALTGTRYYLSLDVYAEYAFPVEWLTQVTERKITITGWEGHHYLGGRQEGYYYGD